MRPHAGRDRIFFTGSGASLIAPLVGGRTIQEVVAVAASVERLHPDVRFVSEIGGEDMKTIFFTPGGDGRSKQVYMQSACSGGTGTFIEKTARKLQVSSESLSGMDYLGHTLHKVSSKCGIFAEADANTLVKSGVTVDGDHRQPLRGRGVPEPCHADERQHADAGRAPARRPESVLQGSPAGVAASPRQALGEPSA